MVTDRERQTLRITVGSILLVKHVVQGGDFTVSVGDLHEITLHGSNSDNGKLTIGNPTEVGEALEPHSLMSLIHFSWSSNPFAEMPITFTFRFAKSGALYRDLHQSEKW